MTQSLNFIPVLISGLLLIVVTLMGVVLKFLRNDIAELRKDRRADLVESGNNFRQLGDFVTNHYSSLNRAIGRIEGKLGIKNDEK